MIQDFKLTIKFDYQIIAYYILNRSKTAVWIDCFYLGRTAKIVLTGREAEFAEDMLALGIADWNGRDFSLRRGVDYPAEFDDKPWQFYMKFDGEYISAKGNIFYPPNWQAVQKCLAEKWGAPKFALP